MTGNFRSSEHPRNNFFLLLLKEPPNLFFHTWWLPSGPEFKTGGDSFISADSRCHKPQHYEDKGQRQGKHEHNQLLGQKWLTRNESTSPEDRTETQFLLTWPCPYNWKRNFIVWTSWYSDPTCNLICLKQKHFVMWFKEKSLIQIVLFNFKFVLLAKAVLASFCPICMN